MVENELLKGQLYADGHWGMYPLSWEGQDFLQAAQDDTVWSQAKEKAGGLFNTLSIDIVMALLKQVLKERLNLELG